MYNLSRILYRVFLSVILVSVTETEIMAQCAMCRTTLENNVSNGDVGIAANLNFGILYLFITPYLLVSIIAYFWYKSSRAQLNQKESILKRLNQVLGKNS